MFLTIRRRRHGLKVFLFELVTSLTLLAGAAVAGIVFVHRPTSNRFDAWGFSLLGPHLDSRGLHLVADLGTVPVLVIGSAAALLCTIWRDWARAAACVIGPLVAVVITERIAKPLADHHVAVLGADSFPSGTVTAATALVVIAFLAAPRFARPFVAIVGAGVVIAVSSAVIAMRWHYPTDALGGIFVGSGSVLLFDALFHLPTARRSTTPSNNASVQERSRALAPM